MTKLSSLIVCLAVLAAACDAALPVPTRPSAPSLSTSSPPPPPGPPGQFGGLVIDDDTGQPVVGAHVGFYAEFLGKSDSDGRYLIDVAPWFLSDALEVSGTGYERTVHFLPKAPMLDYNLRIAPVRRIAPGDTVTITVHPESGLCGFDLDMTCRLLRAGGSLRVELESGDSGALVGLSTVLDPYSFTSTASIRLAAGQGFQVLTPGVPQAPVIVTLRARADP